MHSERITTKSHPLFEKACALYETAFPWEERRDREEQLRILAKPDYHCTALVENGEFLGILFYWQAEDTIFLEHFATLPHLRGHGIGAKALKLLQDMGKPILLEIEPPCDEMTHRRCGFYRRNGFLMNPYFHIQVKLHREDEEDVELKVLTWPEEFSPAEYEAFRAYMLREIGFGC